ncbi:sugar phosphate isomerase/epimerase [bacterium]|nr:sugar phosphate isomerase/epimerase [bacterium]NCQ55278.1 sugar phosphate isomerase/epimerase [Candidatus Parcubacteria bacterium]NCS67209.1 sugar phosphate isomerase/epimerase [Candidatus Peregrinibacteria bacterium]NCS96464.1 sugar phosphate isomerase/epimerase [bacterium]
MLLFHSDNLPHHGLERIFELAKEAGFDGMEIGINQNVDTHNPEYLKILETRFNMPIKAFSLNESKDESLIKVFQGTVREFTNCTLNLHTAGPFAFKYQRWLKEIAPKLAKKYQHRLCFRNLPHESIMGVIPKRRSNNLDALKNNGLVCLDLTALALGNNDIMQAITILKGSMKHIYLSNVYRRTPYSLPDRGVLPVESFLTKLAKLGYSSNFTVKVSGRSLQEGNEAVTLQKMQETVEFYRTYFNQDGLTKEL